MWAECAPDRRARADVTGRVWGDKALRAVPRCLFRLGRAGQQFLDLDRDLVATDDHGAFGDRHVIGQDPDLVIFGRVEFDDGAAAETEYLMDRHRCRAKHDRDIDRDIVQCRQGAPAQVLLMAFATIFYRPSMVIEWLTYAAT